MINFKKILIVSLLLWQVGCTSLKSKDFSANTERVPASNSKIVALVGFERSPENIQSEELVGRLFLSLQSHFRYCYEKELNSNPALKTELFFYFGVTQKGLVHNVTSEAVEPGGNSIALSQCLSSAILKARAPILSQDLVFRARLRFQVE